MREDTNFDGLADSFEGSIYGSSKGYIRLNVLWTDLLSEIPELQRGGLRVLDAGGGAGHMTLRIARMGNEVVLCDPSREMFDKAEKVLCESDLSDSVEILQAPIQDLGEMLKDEFDVITCHAVLEWLAEPRSTLEQLTTFLKLEGRLSLLFYNRNAALMKRVLARDFDTALQEYNEACPPRGRQRKATPLAEAAVSDWLESIGIEIRSKSGIRIFHDHLPDTLREEQLAGLLTIEETLRKQEPFSSLAQHIHLVCGWSRQE